MPIKLKVFIQTLQKSQDRHKISFSFQINNKNIKKVFGANLPPSPDNINLSFDGGFTDLSFDGGGGLKVPPPYFYLWKQ